MQCMCAYVYGCCIPYCTGMPGSTDLCSPRGGRLASSWPEDHGLLLAMGTEMTNKSRHSSQKDQNIC